MAMMISKFHRLVQSKKVWGAFAVLISIAFIFAFNGARSGGSNQNNGDKIAGKIFGEEVSLKEFSTAQRNVRLHFLFDRQNIPNELVPQEAWFRLMELKKAEQMGLRATKEQIDEYILTVMDFKNEEGKVDRARYDDFLNNTLPKYDINITDDEFYDFVGELLTIQMLEPLSMIGALATQSDIEELYHKRNDMLTVAYTAIPRELAPEPEVTLEYKQSYFEEHKSEFTFPETRVIQFVAFPVSDYTNDVVITEEEISQYYEATKSNYLIEKSLDEEDTALEAETEEDTEPTYKPLEKVRGEIVADLTKYKGRDKAYADAAKFFKQLGKGLQSMEDLANASDIPVTTSAAIPWTEPLDGTYDSTDDAFKLTQYAFTIPATREQSPYTCFTEVLRLENAVYLMECIEINKAYPPETYEEVEAQVTLAATEQAIENAYQEKAREILADVQEALNNGSTFEDAIGLLDLDLEISSVGPFSQENLPTDYEESVIAQQTISLESDDLADQLIIRVKPLDEEDEEGDTVLEYVVAYATNKTPADFSAATEDELKDIKSQVLIDEATRLSSAWQASLRKEAALEDMLSK
ncbi:MAG: SurA N-terminal domain-containing protein [Pontiellaceae bacterium]|nr:SurA N-terminal domain-containing protein [Pontiellaceae bacterium]